MEIRKGLQSLWIRAWRWVIITICIVGFGLVLRLLPSHYMMPLHLIELALRDQRICGRTWLYDHLPLVRATNSTLGESPIAMILITQRDYETYGFPPDREAIADVVAALEKHGAKVIAFDMTFELERDQSATERLAKASKRAGNVVYPFTMTAENVSLTDVTPNFPALLQAYLGLPTKGALPKTEMMPDRLPRETLLESAAALGHIWAPLDRDGKIRRFPLVMHGDDGLSYPSLSLMVVSLFSNIPKEGITIEWGKRIILDNQQPGKDHWYREIPIDHKGQMQINYTRRLKSFANRYVLSDVHLSWQSVPGLHEPPIQLEEFRGKMVLIGYLKESAYHTPIPLELKFPGVAVHATIIENILQGDFVQNAGFGLDALVLSFFTALMVISQAQPKRLSSRGPKGIWTQIASAVVLILGFILFNFIVFCAWGIFLNLTLPLMSMALACFTAMGYRYVTTTKNFIGELKQKQEVLKQQQEELKQQKAYNELILEHMGNGLIVLDKSGKVTTLNQKAAQLFNLSESQICGKSVTAAFGKDFPEMADGLNKALDWKMTREDKMRNCFPHGTLPNRFPLKIRTQEFDVSLSDCIGELSNYCSVIAVMTDVTPVRRLEREIQLKRHHEAYAMLATQLNHRLSNDLLPIMSTINPLRRRIESNRVDEALECVEEISQQVDKLNKITTAFKSGISTEKQLQNGSWHDINLNEVVKSVSQTINDNIKVILQLDEYLPSLRLKLDWVKDAIQNLVNNAIDAMPQGGVLTITTEALPTGIIQLTISDTGEGIPDNEQGKIFNPWYTTKEYGSGMGLYMVQLVMLNHNGDVQFESEEGKGTTFRLLFPSTYL
jgi:nitrogen-specific signal transduction histidine kinase/CHASE2 domain-containing sensor protein